jgi:hypothetical protein
MSAPMIAWAPVVNRAYQFMTSFSMASYPSIDIPSVDIHDVETAPEKRARTLKHLLKANHVNFAVLFHDLQFDNHMAHILCSAYILGANEDHLNHIYTEMSKILDEWTDSPAEITDQDWRQFLGDRRYQRAYVDFFEDELALKHDYNWKIVVKEFFFEGENPLINCVISGRMFFCGSILVCTDSYSWPSFDTARLCVRVQQQRDRHGSARACRSFL